MIFTDHKNVILQDLSSNGTLVNEAMVGRNNIRKLKARDEIAVTERFRFEYRPPAATQTSEFLKQYTLLESLAKGDAAEVFLCLDKPTGQRYAVKIYSKTPEWEPSAGSKARQNVATLMRTRHPNIVRLYEAFNEPLAIYLVLELAAEGELFNYIITNEKLPEDEARKVFTQLFHAVQYLVSIIGKRLKRTDTDEHI